MDTFLIQSERVFLMMEFSQAPASDNPRLSSMQLMMMMMPHLLAISTSFLLYTSLVSTTCLLRNSATCLAGNSVSQT